MPTYEYICRACQHAFEEFQSIKADPIRVCPKCRKKKVERLIGIGGAVIFKGGGFYETDYRSASYAAGESEAKKSSEASAASKTDAKTDAKSEARSDASSNAKSGPSTDQRSAPSTDANSAAKPDAKSESKPSTSADTNSSSSDNKRIADRATHPSRVGRGIGNIVKAAQATPQAKPPATPPTKPQARSSAKAPTAKTRKRG